MFEANQVGRSTRLTVAGVTVISTVGSVAIIGVCNNASVTGATTIQIWAGTTATATAAGVPVTGVVTFISGTATGLPCTRYLQIPAFCSSGAVVNIAGDASPDLTLYWNPT